jgi:hypothetical protein
MTPLADGGDRIAANAAIRAGVMIAPALPSSIDRYRATLGMGDETAVAASIREFDKIIEDQNISYSPCILSNVDLASDSDAAKEAYRALSTYMIANSHVIISLWDGIEYFGKKIEGGTYDTVRMAYKGIDHNVRNMAQPIPDLEGRKIMSPDRLLDISEDCLIYFIKSGRILSDEDIKNKGGRIPEQKVAAGTSAYIVPEMVSEEAEAYENKEFRSFLKRRELSVLHSSSEENVRSESIKIEGETVKLYADLPKYYHHIFSKIDVLNKDIKDHYQNKKEKSRGPNKKERTDEEKRDEAYGYMFGSSAGVLKKGNIMTEMISRKMITDDLAVKYQSLSFKNIKISLVLTALTALLLQIYVLIGGELLMIILYIAALGIGMLMYRMHKKKNAFQKFIEYRLIAESLRVSCYWSILCINESVTSSCYGYMKNDMMWIRCVLTAWESYFLNDHTATGTMPKGTRRDIGLEWIEGQKSYHKSKKAKNSRKNRSVKKAWYVVRYSLLALSVSIFLFSLMFDGNTALYSTNGITAWNGILLGPVVLTEMSFLQLALIIFSTAMIIVIGVEDKLIHGGTSGQIEAKYRMFDIACKRLKIMQDKAGEEEIGDIRRSVYYELGSQCIDEVNDWAFEHLLKDVEAPSGKDIKSNKKIA